MLNSVELYQGDCLIEMNKIADKSVDMILADLPYGTTACKWDIVIPFEPLWKQYNRVIKDNGAIVLFGKQPFTTLLIYSNIKNFKHCIVWQKDNVDNFTQAKRRILNITEDICVFYKNQCIYNPQGIIKVAKLTRQGRGESLSQNNKRKDSYFQEYSNYPRNILTYKRDKGLHPTQKPVALLEYLIKTYTNEGDTVLDNVMGSGSTGVACVNTNRSFIGIEMDEKYCEIATNRINDTINKSIYRIGE